MAVQAGAGHAAGLAGRLVRVPGPSPRRVAGSGVAGRAPAPDAAVEQPEPCGALPALPVLGDLRVWSGRASASAGIELMRNEVLALGNSPAWGGRLRIAHGVMADAMNLDAVLAVLRALGFRDAVQVPAARRVRLRAVLAKADPGSAGEVRGRRHTMPDDSGINATRHARAVAGGVVAAAVGMTDLFISGGAEHQGSDGGGPVAIIADMG